MQARFIISRFLAEGCSAKHPGEVESLRRKDTRQTNILKPIPIAKVFDFGGDVL
jgi:hypothetical protein